MAAAARSRAAVSAMTSCGPRCKRRVREATSADRTGSAQWPSGRRAAPKTLPERRQVRAVDDDDGVDRHLPEPVRGRAEADALTLGEGQHPARLVSVDDARGCSPSAALLQDLGHHLDPPDVAPGIEDLAGMDHRVRHRFEVGQPAALG